MYVLIVYRLGFSLSDHADAEMTYVALKKRMLRLSLENSDCLSDICDTQSGKIFTAMYSSIFMCMFVLCFAICSLVSSCALFNRVLF